MGQNTTTHIDSDGGTVVTGNISSGQDVVLGDKNVTINQILADQALTNEVTILAYLEEAAKKQPPPDGSSDEIRKLWDTPFLAHQAGESSINPVPLWKLVRSRFDFAQNNQLPSNLLLMANAGMGKTGALSVLMDARATLSVINYKSDQAKSGGSFRANRTFIIPIFLDLELLLNSEMSVMDLVSDAFNGGLPKRSGDALFYDLVTKEEAEDFLNQYTCLFLIDNLDLLITKADHFLIKMVRQFIQVNHRHQYVIACRPTHYRGQLGRHERIFLNELTDPQVENILDEAIRMRLRGPLRDLARNRSHLKMIIEIPKGRRAEGFPPLSKGHLIQHAERKRLDEAFSDENENENGKGRSIDIEVAEEVLERLAFEMSRSNHGICSDSQAKWLVKEFLEEWDEPYTWRVVMTDLKNAGLIQRAGRRDWSFVHRKTEAYFSAASLAENINKIDGNLDKMAMPRGNETLEILTGLINNPEHLIDKLLAEEHIFTAVHIGQFTRRPLDPRTLDKLFEKLMDRMKGEHASRRAEIALQLGESGHEAAIKALVFLLVNERSSLVVKSIATAIWVCVSQIDSRRFDRILHKAVADLEEDKHISNSNVDMPDSKSLLSVLRVFERGAYHSDLVEQHKNLIRLVESPEEHRLVRGLAGFGLGFIADGLLNNRSGEKTPLSKDEARELNKAAREKLLQFLEFRYAMNKPDDEAGYLRKADTADDLFVSWCCTDALTQLDHNSVLLTAVRLCNDCVGDTADEAEIRAQAVYVMGVLGRRTAHKHDLVSKTLLNLLYEEPTAHNARAHGYAAQAVARLWIGNRVSKDMPVLPDSVDARSGVDLDENKLSDRMLRKRAARNLVQCRDRLEEMMETSHHSWLRRKISEALGEIGTAKALELLKQQVRLEMSRTRTLRNAVQLLNERLDSAEEI